MTLTLTIIQGLVWQLNLMLPGTAFTSATHDFHLSRCEINYETASGDIQIAAHVFIDDLELALKKSGIHSLYICTPKESERAQAAIETYMHQKLAFYVNGKKIVPIMLGKEASDDLMAVWCYFEISGNKNLHQLKIENKILTELFNDQKNIVDFTVNKRKKGFAIFDSERFEETFSF
jgi:hypothetical protein